jgi:cation diffusion facilitator CzcD-associated flavoprotein CzcO
MYASLRTNLPREVMGFLDFPFAAASDSVDARRFPRHQEVLRYIQAFAHRFHLHGLVRRGEHQQRHLEGEVAPERSRRCR